jgi:hypothetical protein
LRFGFALWPVSWTRLRFSAVIRSTTALGLPVGFDLLGKPRIFASINSRSASW